MNIITNVIGIVLILAGNDFANTSKKLLGYFIGITIMAIGLGLIEYK